MDELVGMAFAGARESTQFVDHAPTRPLANPDIAVDYPHNVSLGFTVRSGHVPNFGVRAQRILVRATPRGQRPMIIFLDEYSRVGPREVAQESLQDGVGWVMPGRDAQVGGEFSGRVVLAERRSETLVQARFEALDGPDDGDVRRVGRSRRRGNRLAWNRGIMPRSVRGCQLRRICCPKPKKGRGMLLLHLDTAYETHAGDENVPGQAEPCHHIQPHEKMIMTRVDL